MENKIELISRRILNEYNYYNPKKDVINEDDEDMETSEDDTTDINMSDASDEEININDEEIDSIEGNEEIVDDIQIDEEEEGTKIEVTDIIDRQDILKNEIDKLSNKISQMSVSFEKNFSVLDNNIKNDILNIKDDVENEVNSIKREIVTRNPTNNEKIAMQAIHTYPYNIKLSDYWKEEPEEDYDYQKEFDKKYEKQNYILTQNEIDDYNENEIMKKF